MILEAHLDMVQHARNAQYNWSKGVDVQTSQDGKYLHGNFTTLGADCGIGVATIMDCVLNHKKYEHPAFEFLSNWSTHFLISSLLFR
ncbi:hypothetical protein FACS1894166_10070 [Bacilli bacterium]|nr:hypothetical protein FACS1894166_10070 [Bacilli bacterium]